MDTADLWDSTNHMAQADAKQLLQEFSNSFKWKNDGTDTLLDIGCASGNITANIVLPMLPNNFQKLVGWDISENMVQFAREKYGNSRIEFVQKDICANVNYNTINRFDNIVSFYCLNWVALEDQEKAIQNMFNLLSTGGCCLLCAMENCAVFDAYVELAEIDKYNPYMNDTNLIPPFRSMENPIKFFEENMYNAGFKNVTVCRRDRETVFRGHDHLNRFLQAVNPSVALPRDLRDEYFQEYFTLVNKIEELNNPMKNIDSPDEKKFTLTYKILTCVATK